MKTASDEIRIVLPANAPSVINRLTWDSNSEGDDCFTVTLSDKGYRIEGMSAFIWEAGNRYIYHMLLDLLMEAKGKDFYLDIELLSELIDDANRIALEEAEAARV